MGLYIMATETFSESLTVTMLGWISDILIFYVSLIPRIFVQKRTCLGTALQGEQVRTSVQIKHVSGSDGFTAVCLRSTFQTLRRCMM